MNKTLFSVVIGLALVFILAYAGPANRTTHVVPARAVLAKAEELVKDRKPPPPASARAYAYVATAYADTLTATHSSEEATRVAEMILGRIFTMEDSNKGTLSPEAQKVFDVLVQRMSEDGFSNEWKGVPPRGEYVWVGEKPLVPAAGTWKRWVIPQNHDFKIPPPPTYGSPAYTAAVKKVAETASLRTAEQGAAVNFWGGIPGTVAPAGIWQDVFFAETKSMNLTDEQYAEIQKALAQGIADSFMECWRAKYTFWTKRPSMVDPTIPLAMPNPNFPSYVSGHSTISATAATILSAYIPEKKELWFKDAEQARDSRLWAGIHFEHDNMEGFKLGKAVGDIVVTTLKK